MVSSEGPIEFYYEVNAQYPLNLLFLVDGNVKQPNIPIKTMFMLRGKDIKGYYKVVAWKQGGYIT